MNHSTIARRMALRGKMGKKEAHQVFKAIKNHKNVRGIAISNKTHSKNPDYKKMSIDEYEAKYK